MHLVYIYFQLLFERTLNGGLREYMVRVGKHRVGPDDK